MLQKESSRCHSTLALRMQDDPISARRTVLRMAGASLLLSGGQAALAKDVPKGKPVFVEKGLSYIVKKDPDGGPLAKLALAVSPGLGIPLVPGVTRLCTASPVCQQAMPLNSLKGFWWPSEQAHELTQMEMHISAAIEWRVCVQGKEG